MIDTIIIVCSNNNYESKNVLVLNLKKTLSLSQVPWQRQQSVTFTFSNMEIAEGGGAGGGLVDEEGGFPRAPNLPPLPLPRRPLRPLPLPRTGFTGMTSGVGKNSGTSELGSFLIWWLVSASRGLVVRVSMGRLGSPLVSEACVPGVGLSTDLLTSPPSSAPGLAVSERALMVE